MKLFLRKLVYKKFFRKLICNFIVAYMNFVYFTSRIKFVNFEILAKSAKNKEPLIIVFWHNRLMMIPFIAKKVKKLHPFYNFMTLASKHGDGQFVGQVMENLGLISILGSTQSDKNKRSKGIGVASFKRIFSGFKAGYSLGITPDGPRGPNQKINGEIINIAHKANVGVLALSYSSSKFIELKTWDKFKIPLPFSKICFYLDEEIVYVPKESSESEITKIEEKIEEKMNLAQEKSQEF